MPTKQESLDAQCNFPNRHFTGPFEMVCVLPPGHAGAHQAPYMRKTLSGQEEPATASWTDDAGIPMEIAEAFVAEEQANAAQAAPPSLTQRLKKAGKGDAEAEMKKYIARKQSAI